MRFWHWRILRFLPKEILLETWKDIKLYFQGKRDILVAPVSEFPPKDLFFYTVFLAAEMESRGLRTQTKNIIMSYFRNDLDDIKTTERKNFIPFEQWHDREYYFICVAALRELQLCGHPNVTIGLIDQIMQESLEFFEPDDEVDIEDLA